MRRHSLGLMFVALFLLPANAARAHFLWLVRHAAGESGERVELYFSEVADADDPDLLPRVKDVTVWQLAPGGTARQLKLQLQDDALFAPLAAETDPQARFVAAHDWGIIERGGETFVLRYYAQTGPALGDSAWKRHDVGKHLALNLIPAAVAGGIRITVRWQGEPVAGVQIVASGPGMKDVETETDAQGQATFAPGKPGLYSIRARHIEDQGGARDGREFGSIRHYSTLALQVPGGIAGTTATAPRAETKKMAASIYPVIPEMVTSFGAAIAGNVLYTYGGHTGGAHAYWDKTQAHTLRGLDLKQGKAWEAFGTGPGLQGLAMVAHGGKLYRIGGFVARNQEGEEHDLWSQANMACYDPATKQWTELSPLPEPRSSFDAAVLGDKLYVIGGWQLAGDAESKWHTTAYELDLGADARQWQALPEPPFQRRALSVAAHDGKIFVLGGMQAQGGPTTRVDIFDPATGRWSQGPALQGEPMDGFGSSAFATGGRLYVSTYSGKLQRLSEDGESWEVLGQLDRARFFHRMLPLSPTQLIVVGGASMETGKFDQVDVIEVP